MTALVASPRHRLGHGAPPVASAPSTAVAADLILWRPEGDGVWVGRFDHSLEAGTVRRTAAGYAVESWDGSPEGVFSTLAAAQRSLEPAYRAWLRSQEEDERRHGVLGTVLAGIGLLAVTGTVVAGLLTAAPL